MFVVVKLLTSPGTEAALIPVRDNEVADSGARSIAREASAGLVGMWEFGPSQTRTVAYKLSRR